MSAGAQEPAKYPEAIAVELHLAFPAYTVTVRRDQGEPRYQLLAKDDRYPNCIISPDPDEIRAVLNGEAMVS
jgi:hypothetical protein